MDLNNGIAPFSDFEAAPSELWARLLDQSVTLQEKAASQALRYTLARVTNP
jgi:hypothetical protein